MAEEEVLERLIQRYHRRPGLITEEVIRPIPAPVYAKRAKNLYPIRNRLFAIFMVLIRCNRMQLI